MKHPSVFKVRSSLWREQAPHANICMPCGAKPFRACFLVKCTSLLCVRTKNGDRSLGVPCPDRVRIIPNSSAGAGRGSQGRAMSHHQGRAMSHQVILSLIMPHGCEMPSMESLADHRPMSRVFSPIVHSTNHRCNIVHRSYMGNNQSPHVPCCQGLSIEHPCMASCNGYTGGRRRTSSHLFSAG